MSEFDFDKVSARRIEKVIQQNLMSLQDCADILELVAPLCTVFTCECLKNKLNCLAEDVVEDKIQLSILDMLLSAIAKSGKSVNQIALESGVSRNTISAWANGKASPTVFNAEAVLNTIGYTLILGKTEKTDGENG